MGSDIDRAISIEIMVRTGGNAACREICACIGHSSIDGIAAKRTMIGAETREAARTATADVFSFGSEDKEDIVNAR